MAVLIDFLQSALFGCVLVGIWIWFRRHARRRALVWPAGPTKVYGALDERWIDHAERHGEAMRGSVVITAPSAIRSVE